MILVLQCRQCRNINYEQLVGFVCNECGHSRFARFEFSITAAPSPVYPPIRTTEERAAALNALRTAGEDAYKKHKAHSELIK